MTTPPPQLSRSRMLTIVSNELAAINRGMPPEELIRWTNKAQREFVNAMRARGASELYMQAEARDILRGRDPGGIVELEAIQARYPRAQDDDPAPAHVPATPPRVPGTPPRAQALAPAAPEPRPEAPRRAAVVHAPDDQEFEFRAIIGERLGRNGPTFMIDWAPSEVLLGDIPEQYVTEYRNSARDARAALR